MVPGLTQPSALCIEGQTNLVPILREVLLRVGFSKVVFASSLGGGRNTLGHKTFGLVIVDVHVAQGDDDRLAEFMKMEFASEVPTRMLMVTSMGWQMRQFADSLAVECIVRKPFSPQEFLAALQRQRRVEPASASPSAGAARHARQEASFAGDKEIVFL